MAHYPLDKRFHPDFAQPGRKPVGEVEIEFPPHLAIKDLRSVIYYDGSGALDQYNRKNYGTTVGSGTTESAVFRGKYCASIPDGGNRYIEYSGYGKTGTTSAALGITMAATFYTSVAKSWAEIISYGNTGALAGIGINSAGKVFPNNNNTWTATYNIDWPLNAWVTIVAVLSNGVVERIVVHNHDTKKLQIDGGQTFSSITAQDPGDFFVGASKFSTSGRYFAGYVSHGFFANSQWSEAQAISYALDPYQIVKPKVPLFYFTPEAAAASGGYFIPDPRWEMPELLMPGRKPLGLVQVDWSKAITKGLFKCFIVTDQQRLDLANVQADALGNRSRITENSATPLRKTTKEGIAFAPQFGGTGPGDVVFGSNERRFSSETTVVTGQRGDTLPDGGGWTVYRTGGSRIHCYFFNDALYAIFTSVSGQRVPDSGSAFDLSDGLYHNIALRADGTNAQIFVDGLSRASEAVGGLADQVNTKISVGRDGLPTGYHNGVYYLFEWDRALSDTEIKSLHLDPYQFLIPK